MNRQKANFEGCSNFLILQRFEYLFIADNEREFYESN